MLSLPLCEQFLSIQGESSYAGRICWFIRLTGCNLRCSYCDTRYAVDEDVVYETVTISDLVCLAVESGADLVEITGGEPLIHAEMPRLAQGLLDAGLTVLVETNGAADISLLPMGCIRIMDVKTPSSGMADRHMWSNMAHLRNTDEVKFVVGDRDDFDYACEVIARYRLIDIGCRLHLSPVADRISPAVVVEWILSSKLPLSLNLQLHKYIWPVTARGV